MGISIWQILLILIAIALPISAFVMGIIALAKLSSINRRLSKIEDLRR